MKSEISTILIQRNQEILNNIDAAMVYLDTEVYHIPGQLVMIRYYTDSLKTNVDTLFAVGVKYKDPNNNSDEQFIKMTKCSNENTKINDDCYKTSDGKKIYSTNPQANNSIFGYDASGKPQKQVISTTDHVYDLVLFIYENNKEQNVDQKKNYLGTINVEVTNDIDAFIAGNR